MDTVYVVFRNKENAPWEIMGIYEDINIALKNCSIIDGVMPVPFNEKLPEETIIPTCFWPNQIEENNE